VAGRLLLDTSHIIDALDGNIAALLLIKYADEVMVPVIAVGELLEGAERSDRREAELARVEEFIAHHTCFLAKQRRRGATVRSGITSV
jgi:predicted nucleic acid-binding protein